MLSGNPDFMVKSPSLQGSFANAHCPPALYTSTSRSPHAHPHKSSPHSFSPVTVEELSFFLLTNPAAGALCPIPLYLLRNFDLSVPSLPPVSSASLSLNMFKSLASKKKNSLITL